MSGPPALSLLQCRPVNLDALACSKQWVQAWNARDVEAVLEHFHEDVVFTSRVAATVLPKTKGIVHGKPALRRYWTQALQRIPNLRFVVESVYQGIDTIVITYRNQNDHLVNEVLRFSDDKVIEGHGMNRPDSPGVSRISRAIQLLSL